MHDTSTTQWNILIPCRAADETRCVPTTCMSIHLVPGRAHSRSEEIVSRPSYRFHIARTDLPPDLLHGSFVPYSRASPGSTEVFLSLDASHCTPLCSSGLHLPSTTAMRRSISHSRRQDFLHASIKYHQLSITLISTSILGFDEPRMPLDPWNLQLCNWTTP